MKKYLNKIIKLFTLSIIVFSASGCYAEYEIDLMNFNVNEQIYINEQNTIKYNDLNVNSYRYYVDKLLSTYTSINYSDNQDYFLTAIEEGFDGYKKTLDTSLGYGVRLSTSYTLSSYFSGTAVKSCYENVSFKNENGTYIIETSDKFLCLNKYIYAEYIKIHFKTDYTIISNNADEVLNDGTLEWIINNNNYDNKPIKIKTGDVYKDEVSDEYSSSKIADTKSSDNKSSNTIPEKIKKENNVLLIIFLSMVGITLIVVLIIYLKYKKSHSYK